MFTFFFFFSLILFFCPLCALHCPCHLVHLCLFIVICIFFHRRHRLQLISVFRVILIFISSFAFYVGLVRLDHALRLSLYPHVIDHIRVHIFLHFRVWTWKWL